MHSPSFETFDDFWPFYVREHSNKLTRQLHFVGTGAALATLAAATALRSWRLALVAPVLGYGPAWLSHFAIEKNRPATFRHPRWSLQADLKMFAMMLNGTMDGEVRRILGNGSEQEPTATEDERLDTVAPVQADAARVEHATSNAAAETVWN